MGFGPCMCGDSRCNSCGPAQGFYQCPACGRWNDDEDDDGNIGCVDPEACEKKCDEIAEGEAKDYAIEQLMQLAAVEQGGDGHYYEGIDYPDLAKWQKMSYDELKALIEEKRGTKDQVPGF